MKRIFAILFLMFFVPVVLSPALPFFLAKWHHVDVFSQQVKKDCSHDNPLAKMSNNGDMYLQALLKRFCNTKKKSSPQNLPAPQISVFVQRLTGEFPAEPLIPFNYHGKVSDFLPMHYYYQPDFSIFHPPLMI